MKQIHMCASILLTHMFHTDFLIARCDEILNDRSHQTYQTLKGTNIPPEALINWALSGIFVPFDFYSGQQ